MTLDELLKDWKEYDLVSADGTVRKAMKDIAMLCMGPFKGGLLFDAGGPQGAPAWILKPDAQGNCWLKTDWDAPDDQAWELAGRFERRKRP